MAFNQVNQVRSRPGDRPLDAHVGRRLIQRWAPRSVALIQCKRVV